MKSIRKQNGGYTMNKERKNNHWERKKGKRNLTGRESIEMYCQSET